MVVNFCSAKKKIPAKRLSGSCQVMSMTSEEIKATYSMRDILTKCGLPAPNRAGFCHCPFHKGDREPSMKFTIRIFIVLPVELTGTSLILSVGFTTFHSKMLSGCSEAIIKKTIRSRQI